MNASFFLGANSKSGFYSLYDELIDLRTADTVFIIKGSPGCGKSSFMRRIQKKLAENGAATEQIYCSSDPNSLDGVVFPEIKTAFVDGTAPHVIEPNYPLIVEKYLNLGDFADIVGLRKNREGIISIKHRYQEFFKRVYRLTACAAALDNEMFDLALGGISIERLQKKSAGIISREIVGIGNGADTKKRFLSAISPSGYVTLFDTVHTLCSKLFVMEDHFGLGHFLLLPILKAAEEAKFQSFACYSPLHPERLEHLLIPELSLAFITTTKQHPYEGEYYRKIRIDAMIQPEVLRDKKQKIGFSKKLSAALVDEACQTLKDSKVLHDEMESLYNPFINFDGIYGLADKIADQLLEKYLALK